MSKRSYQQFCGLARALDVVGERWTLLIIRELMQGPKRYSDVLDALPGIGTSLLAERFKTLEREGVVQRGYLPPPAASTVYELTEDGRDLADAMVPLAAWGARRLGKLKRGESIRIHWVMLFLAASCDESRSKGVRETYEIRLQHGVFHVRADDGRLEFNEGPAEKPDLVVETDLEMLTALGTGDVDLAQLSKRLKVTGSRAAALRAQHILTPPSIEPADVRRSAAARR